MNSYTYCTYAVRKLELCIYSIVFMHEGCMNTMHLKNKNNMLMVQTTVHHNSFQRANVNVNKIYIWLCLHTLLDLNILEWNWYHIFIIFIPFSEITKME